MGADRSAALALPALLLAVFDDVDIDRVAVEEALRYSAASLFDEVRLSFAEGAARVWPSACGVVDRRGRCRHEVLWSTVPEGLRDCRWGPWKQGRRLPKPLNGPYEKKLRKVDTKDLRLNRLVAPLVEAADAVRSESCVATAARSLLDALLEAHRRSADHWASEGYGEYGPIGGHRPMVARALIELAASGDAAPLRGHVRAFTSNARALDQLLRDLAVVFTYDATLRRESLLVTWREVMQTSLDAIDEGANFFDDDHWSEYAVTGLIPAPEIEISDTDIDATLRMARKGWIDPDGIADLVTRWLPIGRREPKSVDGVTRLAFCANEDWQATRGLVWVEDVIDGQYAAIARRCWHLTDWLESVRASGKLNVEGTARWRRIVDGLAAAGDGRAVRLQQSEE
jgi:hypothetical protein